MSDDAQINDESSRYVFKRCTKFSNVWMISETACSSQTKLIVLNLHVWEHRIGYSNLTPDLEGPQKVLGSKSSVIKSKKKIANKVFKTKAHLFLYECFFISYKIQLQVFFTYSKIAVFIKFRFFWRALWLLTLKCCWLNSEWPTNWSSSNIQLKGN